MDIGQKIRNARIAKGLTQEELGNLVGLQKSAIAKYENGRVVNIKRSTLQKLAQALDLKGSDLIIEDDPKEVAELGAKVLLDGDLLDAIEKYYTLPADKQKMIRDLIRGMAE
jgi:repressor LexA